MPGSAHNELWPELPYEAWKDTRETLHLWTQIAGKIRLALTPWLNHSWHVPLYVTARGLSTSPIPYAEGIFEIEFDFNEHLVKIITGGLHCQERVRSVFFAGNFMRRLGILFVERYDTSASIADTEKAIAVPRQGRNIVFFPEGAFTRRAGLSEFYLGAFKVAAGAGLPLVPGIIRGTRSMLRLGQWFPRWTRWRTRKTAPSASRPFRGGLAGRRLRASTGNCAGVTLPTRNDRRRCPFVPVDLGRTSTLPIQTGRQARTGQK